MDIKPTKLIKGKGLAKLLSKENFQELGINLLAGKDGESDKLKQQQGIEPSAQKIQMKHIASHWYKHIFHYLHFLRWPMNFYKV